MTQSDIHMREKLYVMPMATPEEASKRAEELRSKYKYGVLETIGKGHFIVDSIMLVYPEGAQSYMTEEEILKSQPYEKPTNHTICSPTVCRFMEEKYIDQFLNEGLIQISTFEHCKSLENPLRKDNNEGMGEIEAVDGSFKIGTKMRVGNAFILCTSLSNKYHDNKCYLEIFRLPELINAIGEQLYKQGYWVIDIFEGPCVYTDRKVYGTLRNTNIKEQCDKITSVEDIFATISQVQCDLGEEKLYFQKPSSKSIETEYRAVWLVHPQPQQENIIVKIDNPEQYARKVVLNEQ